MRETTLKYKGHTIRIDWDGVTTGATGGQQWGEDGYSHIEVDGNAIGHILHSYGCIPWWFLMVGEYPNEQTVARMRTHDGATRAIKKWVREHMG